MELNYSIMTPKAYVAMSSASSGLKTTPHITANVETHADDVTDLL
jgi:hypothetical protein